MSHGHSDRQDSGFDDLHDLPPDLQALYQRMRQDGVAWRAAPELARVGERLREQSRQLALQQLPPLTSDTDPELPRTSQRRQSISLQRGAKGEQGEDSLPDTQARTRSMTHAHPYQEPHDPRPYGRPDEPEDSRTHSFRRRLGGALAATAAIAIVGAVAALLLSAAPGHSTRAGSPTGSDGSGSNSQSGRWVSLDPLAIDVEFDANDLPAIAPSDPRVVYESLAYGMQQGKAGTLRRTDDAGATWHALPIPVPAAHVGHAGFLVSPLDARAVFLSLVDTNGADCPAGATQPMTEGNPGAVFCWIQYSSSDSGNHWTLTKLPTPGTLTPSIMNNSDTSLPAALDASGNARLYALLECAGGTDCSRLVGSADSGKSWQYADAALMSSGARNICAASADAHGTAVYAVTTASTDCGWLAQQPLTVWRSDDAGAHWKRLGPLATPNIRGLQMAHPSTGSALVYAVEPRTTQMSTDKVGGKMPVFSADPTDVKVSSDGGTTWTNAPSAGIASGMKPFYDAGALGTLSDGSVVVEYVDASAVDNFSGGTLYAWKPGDATWRQLAPPLSWEAGALTVIPPTSGAAGDTLYLVMVDRGGQSPVQTHSTYSFLRYEP